MRNYLIYIPALLLLFAACAKDKGNYDYTELPGPELKLDTMYTAITGDSLKINPGVTLSDGSTDYSCHWRIDVAAEARAEEHDGRELRIVFGLPAGRYHCRLTVANNTTGMKYFYEFYIVGQTEFSKGVLVLSNDQNHTVLSFIKPDGTLRPDLYSAINNETLPGPAMQIVPVQNLFYLNTLTSYWVTYRGDQKGGVLIDAGTLKRLKYLQDNFFDPPGNLRPDYFIPLVNGITTGVMGGKIYIGSDETAPFWPYYGYFGLPINGTYNLASPVINNINDIKLTFQSNGYYLGFDKDKKAFQRFYANTFYGTDYQVQGTAFDPANTKMDMIYMTRFSDPEEYAICDSMGKKIELKFRVSFTDSTKTFYPLYSKPFPAAAQLTTGTVWETSSVGVIFFSANDVIYRYNPLNSDLKQLVTTTGGKKVSMLKIQQGGNLLVAGAEGSLYYLDVSVGKSGELIKKIDGIPGAPQDVILRD